MAQFKKEWNDGTGAVKGTREELGRASKQAQQTAKATDQTGTSVGKLSNNLRNHRKEWDLVGSSLLKTGVGLAAVSGLMVKAAIDWESAWAGVTKTVSGTPAELAAVEAGLRGLIKTMPESHTQIAAVAEAAGQLGVKTKDIVEFTRIMVMLGDTTNLSADEAATSIAQLMNVMQTAPEDVDRLGATLVALGNSGASTERDIIQMAQRIAGAGEIVGFTEAQVLSLANALSSSGIEVEAGGSAISNVLIDISKAVSQGGTKLEEFAKVAGTTATDFAAKWKSDPASALTDFTEGLGGMADRGEDVFGTLEKLGETDVRVTRALLNMANAGDLLRDSLATGDAAWQRNTALVAEAEKRYDTTAAKIQIAWNNIKDNAIDAGQAMLPILSHVTDIIVELAQAFDSLPGPVKAGLGVLASGTGVALLAAGAFLKVVGTASDLNNAFKTLEMSGSRGARGLGTVGKAAGAVGLALAALQIADQLIPDAKVKSTGKYAEAILKIGSNSRTARKEVDALFTRKATGFWGAEVNGLAEALDLVSRSGAAKTLENIQSGFGMLDSAGSLAEESITKYDQALTSLVQSGATDEAARGAKLFADEAKKAGLDSEEVADLLPDYTSALQDAANEQKLAGDSAKKLGADTSALGMALAALSSDGAEAKKILAEIEQASVGAAIGFVDLTDNIDKGVDHWLDSLEKQNKAMENWADNMIKAASRGVDEGVLKKFEEMGPEGAKLLDELVDGSQSSIDRLNEIWGDAGDGARTYAQILDEIRPQVLTQFLTPGADGAIEKAQELAVKYNLTPDEVVTILEAKDYSSDDIKTVLDGLGILDGKVVTSKVKANSKNARDVIAATKRLLRLLDGSTATVYIKGVRTGASIGGAAGVAGGKKKKEKAEGGPIEGVGGPKQDNIDIAASVGEHMWTAQEVANVGGHGAVYAMRAAARAGKRPKFGVGGAVDDAWNESYRSAAAAYGSPMQSVQAPQTLMVDTTGAGAAPAPGVDLRAVQRKVEDVLDNTEFGISRDNRYLKAKVRKS
jgi:TP901 family phage tail tape measure protein